MAIIRQWGSKNKVQRLSHNTHTWGRGQGKSPVGWEGEVQGEGMGGGMGDQGNLQGIL